MMHLLSCLAYLRCFDFFFFALYDVYPPETIAVSIIRTHNRMLLLSPVFAPVDVPDETLEVLVFVELPEFLEEVVLPEVVVELAEDFF